MVVATVALQVTTPYLRPDEAVPSASSGVSVGFAAKNDNNKDNNNNILIIIFIDIALIFTIIIKNSESVHLSCLILVSLHCSLPNMFISINTQHS